MHQAYGLWRITSLLLQLRKPLAVARAHPHLAARGMTAVELMTASPACCTPAAPLQEVARLMTEHRCGAIPVLNNLEMRIPVGIITDRDIICRAVGKGLNPLDLRVADCMSFPVATVLPESSLDVCMLNMMDAGVRRIVVVNHKGGCLGIVSQADIVLHAPDRQLGEMLRSISRYDVQASHVTAFV
jgi:CBS domain-containing protein